MRDMQEQGRLVPLDRAKMLGLLLVCLSLLVAGVVLFRSTQGVMNVLNGVVVGVFAILAGFFCVLLILGRRVALRVTDAGVEDRTRPWRPALVPWSELAGVSQQVLPGTGSQVLLHIRGNESRGAHNVQVRAHVLKGGADAVVAAITGDPHYSGDGFAEN